MDSFGSRLKAIRTYLSLSRAEFSKRHDIPEITLKFWELGKSNISPSQLSKLLSALAREKIYCTEAWILHGEGAPPIASIPETTIEDIGQSYPIGTSNPNIEISLFLKNNPNSIVYRISDQTNFPFLQEGDYIGGIEVEFNKDSHFLNILSIIFIKGRKDPYIKIPYKDDCGRIHLLSTNINALCSDHIFNVEVEKMYEVKWIRKI